jgi:hypothetical protein|tara:strand:- start:1393 stop:1608 length:216 start_codon:yes stop_codon:yes gene_type:complete
VETLFCIKKIKYLLTNLTIKSFLKYSWVVLFNIILILYLSELVVTIFVVFVALVDELKIESLVRHWYVIGT